MTDQQLILIEIAIQILSPTAVIITHTIARLTDIIKIKIEHGNGGINMDLKKEIQKLKPIDLLILTKIKDKSGITLLGIYEELKAEGLRIDKARLQRRLYKLMKKGLVDKIEVQETRGFIMGKKIYYKISEKLKNNKEAMDKIEDFYTLYNYIGLGG
jgi:predicted transcriptional regulator